MMSKKPNFKVVSNVALLFCTCFFVACSSDNSTPSTAPENNSSEQSPNPEAQDTDPDSQGTDGDDTSVDPENESDQPDTPSSLADATIDGYALTKVEFFNGASELVRTDEITYDMNVGIAYYTTQDPFELTEDGGTGDIDPDTLYLQLNFDSAGFPESELEFDSEFEEVFEEVNYLRNSENEITNVSYFGPDGGLEVTSTFFYGTSGELGYIEDAIAGGSIFSTTNLDYNDNGQLTSANEVTDGTAGVTRTFTYDSTTGNISSISHREGNEAFTMIPSYDALGNLTELRTLIDEGQSVMRFTYQATTAPVFNYLKHRLFYGPVNFDLL